MRIARSKAKEAKLNALKEEGLSLLPKRIAKRLTLQGIDVVRYLRISAVSQAKYNDLKRAYEAKRERVEWQSSGIKSLWDTVATLEAEKDMLRSQLASSITAQRLTMIGAELAALNGAYERKDGR